MKSWRSSSCLQVVGALCCWIFVIHGASLKTKMETEIETRDTTAVKTLSMISFPKVPEFPKINSRPSVGKNQGHLPSSNNQQSSNNNNNQHQLGINNNQLSASNNLPLQHVVQQQPSSNSSQQQQSSSTTSNNAQGAIPQQHQSASSNNAPQSPPTSNNAAAQQPHIEIQTQTYIPVQNVMEIAANPSVEPVQQQPIMMDSYPVLISIEPSSRPLNEADKLEGGDSSSKVNSAGEKIQQHGGEFPPLEMPLHVMQILSALGSGGSLVQASKPEKDGGGQVTANAIGYASGNDSQVNASVNNTISLQPNTITITDSATASASSATDGAAFAQATLSSNGFQGLGGFPGGWGGNSGWSKN